MDITTLANLPAPLLSPWAITEEGLKLVVAVASRDSFFAEVRQKALQAREGTPLENTRKATQRGSVAVIPVSGPLFRHAGLMTELSGATSYEDLRKDLQAAIDNPDISAIMFEIDSPGGEVTGCGELSKAIFESPKRTIAYASGQMCSAAFWIGSACDEIVADPSAMIGSIGVRSMMVDDSKAQEMAGVVEYDIVSSQSPYKVADAADKADRARVRETLNAMCSVFVADVARNRAVSEATVLADFGKGDVMIGKAAKAAGLCDRLGDFESLLSELGASSMSKVKNPPVPGAAMKDEKCSRCDRDMDDDDDSYCAACFGKDEASVSGQVFALTGKSNAVEAIGVLTAWKELAGEAGALKEQLKAQALTAESAAFDAEIAQARASGLLAKSDEHKRNKAALAHKGKPGALEGLRSFLAALDPLSAPSAGSTAVAKAPVAVAPAGPSGPSGLTADEEKIIKALGITADKFLAQKAVLKNPRIQAQAAEEK